MIANQARRAFDVLVRVRARLSEMTRPWPARALAILLCYAILFLLLFLILHHKHAAFLMLLGVAYFHISAWWLRRRWRAYAASSAMMEETGVERAPQRSRWGVTIMAIGSLGCVALLGPLAFKGVEDRRMIWAFHEDEGWLADLYDSYVSQKKMNLGSQWGYTYGSFHLMSVSMIARAAHPIIRLDGADCVVLNRLLLLVAYLGLGWLVYYAGVRFLRSPPVAVLAALLFWSNPKIFEMAVPSNYPDLFGALFLTAAWVLIAELAVSFSLGAAIGAPLLLGLGFSVKYMGLPLLPILWLVFRYAQGLRRGNLPLRTVILDLGSYLAYTMGALVAAFVLVNPYYIVNRSRFLHQFAALRTAYAAGNTNNLPASGVPTVGWNDWWSAATSGGAPDGLLFLGAVLAFLLALGWWQALGKRAVFRQTMILTGVGYSFLWIGFIVVNSRYAFAHYFLPVFPILYLSGTSSILLVRDVLPQSWQRLKRRLPFVAALVLCGVLVWQVAQDVSLALGGKPLWRPHSLGYATEEPTVNSRFGKLWIFCRTFRNTQDSQAIEVGRWLKEYCPDARSAIANETIFYYPPSIRDVVYWNRQLSLEVLFRVFPDLLIVSDYFIEMYTRDYAPAEIAAMPEAQRRQFEAAREIYTLLKDRERFLNYRKIHTFKCRTGMYWKNLHVYQREGPRHLGGLVGQTGGSSFCPSPNDASCLTWDGFIMPSEMYLAVPNDVEKPHTLDVRLVQPAIIDGLGVVWYSDKEYPLKPRLRLFAGDRLVREVVLSPQVGLSTAYSWLAEEESLGTADRITLDASDFSGQDRLLLRRFFLGSRTTGR